MESLALPAAPGADRNGRHAKDVPGAIANSKRKGTGPMLGR
jgi:hypothetical protein